MSRPATKNIIMDSALCIDPDQPALSAQANPGRHIPSQGYRGIAYRFMKQHASAVPGRCFTPSPHCWFSRGTRLISVRQMCRTMFICMVIHDDVGLECIRIVLEQDSQVLFIESPIAWYEYVNKSSP